MATLSSYLSGAQERPRRRSTGSYPTIRRYSPYSVPRRGTSSQNQQSAFGAQDLASMLLQQQQQRKLSTPSTTFESSYDYDPILARIRALSTKSLAMAQTEAEQVRRKAVIDSGDTAIGKELKMDENTINAAGQNPESMLSQLAREFASRQKELEESYSAQNLLYSGSYADQLSQLGQGRASAEGQIGSKLRELLSGVDTGLLDAQEAERQRQLEAAEEAAMRRAMGLESLLPGNIDMNDFRYGSTLPAGYSDESIYENASIFAPTYGGVKYVPAHIMNQGMVVDGKIAIKFVDPTGVNPPSTEWIPLPAIVAEAAGEEEYAEPVAPVSSLEEALAAAQVAPTNPYDYTLAPGEMF